MSSFRERIGKELTSSKAQTASEIESIRTTIASIEKRGDVELAMIKECSDVRDRIIDAEKDFQSSAASEAKAIFLQRGCEVLKQVK